MLKEETGDQRAADTSILLAQREEAYSMTTNQRTTTTATNKQTGAYQEMTRTSDEYFDLVSTLYHALKGAKTYSCYAADARAAGDQELAKFFEQCQEQAASKADT